MVKEFRQPNQLRLENERYFTEPGVTSLLLPFIPAYVKDGFILEPAAGRGDMTRVFVEEGYDVLSLDIDISEFDHELGSIREQDFLQLEPWELDENVKAIITNPPYGNRRAEMFVAQALAMPVDYVAMLLRSEFNTSIRRIGLWDRQQNPFAYEIVLCGYRPRWDWWMEKDPWEKEAAPMHTYSWFVWDRNWKGSRTQFFVGKADIEQDEGD
jgi:predicted RNA methylase